MRRNTKNQQRILVMPSPHHPGGGNFYKDHAEALAEQGYEVDILINRVLESARFRISDIGNFWRYSVSSHNNLRIIQSTYRKHPYQALKNIRDWTKSMINLYEQYRKKYGDPHLILVFSAVWTGYAASEISRKFGIPYVITEHRSRFTARRQEALDMIKEPHLPFLESAYSGASKIITVSDSLTATIKKYSGDTEILTIPNLVNTDVFVPPEARMKDPFVILSAGRLESEKGVDLLIQAFDLYAADNPDAALRIVGEGPVEQDLRTMASHTYDPNRIKFLGILPRKEMLKEMQNASMFALTSRFEAFGLAIAEAMATGLPVLATRSGGPETIVTKSTGILVDCESVPAVFVGIKNMYSRYDDFDQQKIIRHAFRKFDKIVVMNSYKTVFDSLLGEGTKSAKVKFPDKVNEQNAREIPEKFSRKAPSETIISTD